MSRRIGIGLAVGTLSLGSALGGAYLVSVLGTVASLSQGLPPARGTGAYLLTALVQGLIGAGLAVALGAEYRHARVLVWAWAFALLLQFATFLTTSAVAGPTVLIAGGGLLLGIVLSRVALHLYPNAA